MGLLKGHRAILGHASPLFGRGSILYISVGHRRRMIDAAFRYTTTLASTTDRGTMIAAELGLPTWLTRRKLSITSERYLNPGS